VVRSVLWPWETQTDGFPCVVQILGGQIHAFRETKKQGPQTYL